MTHYFHSWNHRLHNSLSWQKLNVSDKIIQKIIFSPAITTKNEEMKKKTKKKNQHYSRCKSNKLKIRERLSLPTINRTRAPRNGHISVFFDFNTLKTVYALIIIMIRKYRSRFFQSSWNRLDFNHRKKFITNFETRKSGRLLFFKWNSRSMKFSKLWWWFIN